MKKRLTPEERNLIRHVLEKVFENLIPHEDYGWIGDHEDWLISIDDDDKKLLEGIIKREVMA